MYGGGAAREGASRGGMRVPDTVGEFVVAGDVADWGCQTHRLVRWENTYQCMMRADGGGRQACRCCPP